MSTLDDFGGSMSFTAKVDKHNFITSSDARLTLLIQLTDENEWIEDKVSGYKEIIIRYHGEEHRFTPDEVLHALYAAKEGPIIRCKDCDYKRMAWNGRKPAFVNGCFCAYTGGSEKTNQNGFCSWAEPRKGA